MMRQPDFAIQLSVPANFPTPQEIELYTANLEPFLEKLVETGHLNKEEMAAYLRFTAEFAQFSLFMMDHFLASYRQAREEKPAPSGRIVIPA